MARGASLWIARLSALAAGLAAALAHPPFGVLPGLLGYALLLRLLDQAGPRPLRSAFFRAWLAGVGYFGLGCWWIVEPFFVDAKDQAWMAPIALPLTAGGFALFWGLAGLLYRVATPRGPARLIVFAGAFALFEWLRGHVLTGFPWDLPGETWRAGSAPSQTASLVGAYGLTWITLVLAAAPALLFDPAGRRERTLRGVTMLALLAALYGFGAARLARVPPVSEAAPLIRVVQADIDQKNKWRPENLPTIFATYADLSRRPGAAHPDVVIWPEGALPAIIDELLAPGSPYAPRLRDLVDPGQTLIMGANRAQPKPDGGVAYFNSLIAFRREPQGLKVTAVYDKYRLVPFGEYMPLGALATKVGFRSLVHMPDDFSGGPPPRPVAPTGVPPFQPLICYEALFPGFTREGAARAHLRPAWILNISNDAWFGQTSGPLQHLNLASYRAIEEGLPMVRATPTGVSAVIDAFGRTEPGKRLGLGDFGVIDARLPPALSPTLYERLGDMVFWALIALSGLTAAAMRAANSRRRRLGGT
ncbi:MAG TPA: apolipoprotein N-acyltransferase [Phenylobacterium sp.]|uniref:apolipoprotein N-acyltransferase n=1 Tax=Phenylobacterium sp. TaxID=1871053 RepID=UPI002BEC6780|nr:apolipoprotein N-acyltransferase [Phenylobacterium sp.]HSV02351.1 apolipoprotein N-acyltransferase [Phenylobacterium sp.]